MKKFMFGLILGVFLTSTNFVIAQQDWLSFGDTYLRNSEKKFSYVGVAATATQAIACYLREINNNLEKIVNK